MTFAEASISQRSSLDSDLFREGWSGLDSVGAPSGLHACPAEQLAPMDVAGFNRHPPHALNFGPFRFVLHSRELSADGAHIALGNRALEVLFVLIEARGDLVTKDELLSRVWPTTTVEENNLQFQISSLRKALGPDREMIRTVSGRGYRFVAEITQAGPRSRIDPERLTLDQRSATVVDLHGPRRQGNLPAPASGIVGRDAHLDDVAALTGANRLVTLVGAGGIGKTRLAIELARRLQPTLDAVWIVDLGGLSAPDLTLDAIATAIGLGGGGATPAQIAASLGQARVLLVLDNCEHVIDAVAGIAEDLLHASASLQVIATSREALRAEGEWVYRVPPLDVPPEGDADLATVLQHSAAKLFIERIRAADPAILLGAGVATAATKICRRLDGIPLAIELAAARAAALGVEVLAARIDDRLSLLTDGRRTAPARHQTLRATLDWSYELLTEPERVVMRRLSVFTGDFTMEAAIHIAGLAEFSAMEVVQSVASLVAKSLVVAEAGDHAPRYRLLETMRAYAIDKLAQNGELEAVTRRFAEA